MSPACGAATNNPPTQPPKCSKVRAARGGGSRTVPSETVRGPLRKKARPRNMMVTEKRVVCVRGVACVRRRKSRLPE